MNFSVNSMQFFFSLKWSKRWMMRTEHFIIMPIVCTHPSSDSIATCYGLGGPRIVSPGGGETFCTRPDEPWGPPSLLYNGYQVFPSRKVAGGMALTSHHHLLPRFFTAIPLLHFWVFVACSRWTLPFTVLIHFPGIQSACRMFQYHGTQSHHTPLVRTNTQHIMKFTSKLNLKYFDFSCHRYHTV